MVRKEIITQKTARYYMLGEPSKKVGAVWFVCHGYGQLANDFLNCFDSLHNENNLIISPEGLHRFYLSGVTGKVGASWMTKEERRNDIKDHIAFLNKLYKKTIKKLPRKKIKLNVLGFSQGTATVCRWLVLENIRINNLILWGGEIPADIEANDFRATFKSSKLLIVVGKKDHFIIRDKLNKEINSLKDNKINFELIKYDGGHEIKENVLLRVCKQLK